MLARDFVFWEAIGGAFFAAGGSAYYHSPIQPEPLRHGCHESLLLVNRDPSNAHEVRIVFEGADKRERSFSAPVTLVTFGSEQYVLKNDGPDGHPYPDGPPVTKSVKCRSGSFVHAA